MGETPSTPFPAKPTATPPGGLDFNTQVAMRLDSAESDIRKVIKQQTKTEDTLGKHATRLAEGEGHFTAIRAHLAAIQGAITWTVKLIVGAVLTALLSMVVVKQNHGPTPSPSTSASSSPSWPPSLASSPSSSSTAVTPSAPRSLP